MQNLLKRQLKKYFGDPTSVPERLRTFIEAVDETYCQSDEDRKMLERSLELSSQELIEINKNLEHLVQERIESEKILALKNKKLELLNIITEAVHKTHELEEVYNIALDLVTVLENVDMAAIYLVDKNNKEAVLQAHRNLPVDYILRAGRIPYPQGATWQVINTGALLNCENVQMDPYIGQAGRDIGRHSVLGMPITSEKGVIGVIWFASYKERRFEGEEIDLLTSIGNNIAMAVSKAKLYKDLGRKNRYEEIVRTVIQNVHSSIDLQEVLENAVQSMRENIEGVDMVAIYMVEGEEAVLKSQRGFTDSYIARAGRIPYPNGFTWKTIIEGKPRYCADTDSDEYIGPAGRNAGIKSYLSMPIIYKDKIVGCININSTQKNAFDEEELQLLEIVSQQIRAAIGNAKQAAALRESETRHRTIVEQTYDMTIECDALGIIHYANPQHKDMLGYDPEELVGTNCILLVHEEDRERVMADFQRGLQSNEVVHTSTYRCKHKNGESRWMESTGKTFKTAGGEIHGVISSRDVTENKKMEEELLKSQKLESLSVLAGGIAHDFNNILTIILGNVNIARIKLNPQDKSYERLAEAETAIRTATGLTRQLLTFSKGSAPIKKTMAIDKLLTDSTLFALRGTNIECAFSVEENLLPVEIDEGQINQVINNLIINARHAMPRGGSIDVSAKNIILDQRNTLNLPKGEYVEISVKDSGVGIPEEHLQKIFDPFFTTKKEGSGLGLASAFSIVRQHHGYISVDSELGKGTTFTIYLPAARKSSPATEHEEKVVKRGRGTILIMDDDVQIRDILGEMLTELGYNPQFAKDCSEAIKWYKDSLESGEKIDAVILDLTIPGDIGGNGTLKKLFDINPDIKAIVSSGYSKDGVMADYETHEFKAYLPKPYTMTQLSEVLHDVLKSPKG
jgi:two-component system, cell cycle sensor histidine kinase and response regulator CckA